MGLSEATASHDSRHQLPPVERATRTFRFKQASLMQGPQATNTLPDLLPIAFSRAIYSTVMLCQPIVAITKDIEAILGSAKL